MLGYTLRKCKGYSLDKIQNMNHVDIYLKIKINTPTSLNLKSMFCIENIDWNMFSIELSLSSSNIAN